MTRTPYVVGNWKMYKTGADARAFVGALRERLDGAGGVQVGVCAPFTALQPTVDAAQGAGIDVYAQNMHQADEGAFTGEVSAPMLLELGVDGVLIAHSERRALFNETDKAAGAKLRRALEADLKPILCVGETEEERERDETERTLRHQVQEALSGLAAEQVARVVIAYEPVWAIGTGKVATTEQAQEAIAFVRALVGDRTPEAAEAVRILYGGSVKPDNAHELMSQPDVDGALVGGASLDPDGFAAIVRAAAPAG